MGNFIRKKMEKIKISDFNNWKLSIKKEDYFLDIGCWDGKMVLDLMNKCNSFLTKYLKLCAGIIILCAFKAQHRKISYFKNTYLFSSNSNGVPSGLTRHFCLTKNLKESKQQLKEKPTKQKKINFS